jgi:hypothetical protein
VDASDIRCRCTCKIIARDVRLVASRQYRMAVTRPGSRAAVTLSPSLGADLLGCINRIREKERKALNNHAAYVLVQTQKSRYRLAPYGSFSVDPAHGETPPPLGCDPEVVKTRADAICTGPRSNEVIKYGEEKRREETEERNAQLITFLQS